MDNQMVTELQRQMIEWRKSWLALMARREQLMAQLRNAERQQSNIIQFRKEVAQ